MDMKTTGCCSSLARRKKQKEDNRKSRQDSCIRPTCRCRVGFLPTAHCLPHPTMNVCKSAPLATLLSEQLNIKCLCRLLSLQLQTPGGLLQQVPVVTTLLSPLPCSEPFYRTAAVDAYHHQRCAVNTSKKTRTNGIYMSSSTQR